VHYLRLKKNNQFQKLFKKGKRVFSPCLTLLYVKGKDMTFGIALSKKHGKAVKRNRIKRLVRAAFDKNCNLLNDNYSIVVLPKILDEYDYKNIEKSLISCFKKINQCEN
jgi:ribonuclease P protein component